MEWWWVGKKVTLPKSHIVSYALKMSVTRVFVI